MNIEPMASEVSDTPAAMLDQFRAHPEWTERERDFQLGRLVERFPVEQVVEAIRARLGDLSQGDAEPILRLIEASASQPLSRALATSLLHQPGLAAERAWDALAVLEATGVLDEFPELVERWEDLNESLDDEGSLAQLVEQLDGDPEGVWLALQGLGGVEPEVRAQIIAGLATEAPGPGVVEFLRLLAYAHEPLTRAEAVSVLLDDRINSPIVVEARLDLARHHPDPSIATRARRVAGGGSQESLARSRPRLERSLVTSIDGPGRGSVILESSQGNERFTAAFLCGLNDGITEVVGDIARGTETAFDEYAGGFTGDRVEDAHAFAEAVLAGSLLLCGPKTPPVLRFWLEATLGPGFQARPFQADIARFGSAAIPPEEMPRRVDAVLGSCPDWLDASPLTFEMAEELLLREKGAGPDPKRHSGLYRILFERRLAGQLEGYRRMLLWMTGFWEADGDHELARSSLALAWQLSDAQHVVPGHPFAIALTTRSLSAAMADLQNGRDPRAKQDPGTRPIGPRPGV